MGLLRRTTGCIVILANPTPWNFATFSSPRSPAAALCANCKDSTQANALSLTSLSEHESLAQPRLSQPQFEAVFPEVIRLVGFHVSAKTCT